MISWNPFCWGVHKAPSPWMCPSETLWWECPFPIALFSRKCNANAQNHSIQQPRTSILPGPDLSCPHLSQADRRLSNTRLHLPASSQGWSPGDKIMEMLNLQKEEFCPFFQPSWAFHSLKVSLATVCPNKLGPSSCFWVSSQDSACLQAFP